ncbi:MAG: N-acetylmuramoyl-L-alanine amidase [Acidimicrobiales bacterium]
MAGPRRPRLLWHALGLGLCAVVAAGLTIASPTADRDRATDTDADDREAGSFELVGTTPIPNAPRDIEVMAVGAIDRVSVDATTARIAGWAVDLDDPDASEVRISIDGRPVATVAATLPRPDVGAALAGRDSVGFAARVDLEPGTHRICVHTVPDDDLVSCTRVATDDVLGVLQTPRGVLVEILQIRRNGRYVVRTPCGNRAVVDGGQRIRTTQILLDPGHGGFEVGAVGSNGLSEKNLNLDVSLRTAEELRERGFDVVLTRTTDLTLPIEIRANLANALRPDLFLSIHHNGGATARTPVPGTQAYYQHDDRQSRRAAGILYEELFAAASRFPTAWVGNSKDGVSTRLNAEGTDFYGIHRRTPEVTSVITEFLWLSNGPEAQVLMRDEVRQAQAVALADGVERWYRSTNRGSGFIDPFVDTFDSGAGGFEGCVDPPL